jgi:hypothetical protein
MRVVRSIIRSGRPADDRLAVRRWASWADRAGPLPSPPSVWRGEGRVRCGDDEPAKGRGSAFPLRTVLIGEGGTFHHDFFVFPCVDLSLITELT